jgi:nitroimidazol reductase NimA-like FMN-containing flavoprotein (pyridoxamine 5'-phosphate oxidase superfamily)
MTADRLGMTVLDTHECLALLRTTEVGRLATNGDYPEVLPVNFVVADGGVLFRAADGTKLAALTADDRVAFEADGSDLEAGTAWSVLIKGHAAVVRTPHGRVEALDLPLFPWQVAPKHHFVRISPVEITGRRFTIADTTAARRRRVPAPSAHE